MHSGDFRSPPQLRGEQRVSCGSQQGRGGQARGQHTPESHMQLLRRRKPAVTRQGVLSHKLTRHEPVVE